MGKDVKGGRGTGSQEGGANPHRPKGGQRLAGNGEHEDGHWNVTGELRRVAGGKGFGSAREQHP